MPPPLLTELGSTPYNGGYTVGNAFTPPNRTRVNTVQWNIQGHRVAGGFVIIYSVLGSVSTKNNALVPHIIEMHPNQYELHIHYSYHNVSRLVVLISTFIIIITWLFIAHNLQVSLQHKLIHFYALSSCNCILLSFQFGIPVPIHLHQVFLIRIRFHNIP